MLTKRDTFIQTFSASLVMELIASAVGNLIIYGLTYGLQKIFAPDYKAILMGAMVAIIIGIALAIVIKYIPERYHNIVALTLGIIIGVALAEVASPFPLFEITSPGDNSDVENIITVIGHGGIPNSEIQVFVITNDKYPVPTIKKPDRMGKWSIYPVHIGEPRQIVLEAEIYAVMTTPDGATYESNRVKVKRN